MERDFYTDEFEDLIKQKADQYRMYPSDKVWKGINRSLHSNKKKYWFGFALLLTGLSYFGIDQLIVSPPTRQAVKSPSDNPSTQKQQAKIIPFEQVTSATVDKVVPRREVNPNIVQPGLNLNISEDRMVVEQMSPEVVSAKPLTGQLSTLTIPDERMSSIADATKTGEGVTGSLTGAATMDQPSKIPAFPGLTAGQEISTEEAENKVNWLQEYAIYDLAPSKPKRVNWQLSFAPTMNYRKMTGRNNANIQSSARNIPIALSIEGDLDKLVNHKPALGFELGSFLVYSINHNFALKGGLQFNYSRYEIQAYSTATERATIALNSINGLSSSSISNLTQLRNFGGYAVQDLQNQYFQLSVPLGIEVNLLGSNKLQLGIAGTVQPTYLLNRNTYLISSDYKNYTKAPSLVRRWNVNTSAETFVSYKTAGLKWQVGPQIRYQLFSSYTDKYPIKEYLIEYGVKIGVTKTIR